MPSHNSYTVETVLGWEPRVAILSHAFSRFDEYKYKWCFIQSYTIGTRCGSRESVFGVSQGKVAQPHDSSIGIGGTGTFTTVMVGVRKNIFINDY